MAQQYKRFSSMRRTIAAFVLLLGAFVFIGQSCSLFGGSNLVAPTPITLKIWRTEDGQQTFDAAIAVYRSIYPHVRFEYRVFNEEEYEQALLEAWAQGTGPDIFSIPADRLGKFEQFITPLPQEPVVLNRSVIEKSFGRDIQRVEAVTNNYIQPNQVQNNFAQIVSSDIIVNNQIYGLPLSMDTLGLFYNRDLLSKALIAIPPRDWEEFRNAIQAVTVLDTEKTIILPGADIGAAENVPHFFDLLSVIMMQNGTNMTGPRGGAAFASPTEDDRLAGIEAVDFFMKFSDDRFKTYTWDDSQPNGLDAFVQGDLAFYFGYYGEKDVIAQRNASLNFSYSKLPQIDPTNPVNYADYNVETVHVNSPNADHAWNFIHFLAQTDNAREYLNRSGRLPALLGLIAEQQTDVDKGPFIQQSLTARSWFRGQDPDGAIQVFADMISELMEVDADFETTLLEAQQKMNLTF